MVPTGTFSNILMRLNVNSCMQGTAIRSISMVPLQQKWNYNSPPVWAQVYSKPVAILTDGNIAAAGGFLAEPVYLIIWELGFCTGSAACNSTVVCLKV